MSAQMPPSIVPRKQKEERHEKDAIDSAGPGFQPLFTLSEAEETGHQRYEAKNPAKKTLP